MKYTFLKSLLLCGVMGLSASALAQTGEAEPANAENMIVTLRGNDQSETGTVNIQKTPHGLLFTVEVAGVSEGWHGFHIHETGDCSNYETFTSAGGHAAMPDQNHGFLDESSPHTGDLPNIWVNESGAGKAQFYTAARPESLNDTDGSAFVLHVGRDDYMSDPSGDSGSRIACGVIFPKTE